MFIRINDTIINLSEIAYASAYPNENEDIHQFPWILRIHLKETTGLQFKFNSIDELRRVLDSILST
jgi:hypothetical protein